MTDRSPILHVQDLTKSYRGADRELTVLRGVNLRVHPGDTLAVLGPSGCGKTTLLGLCAGLDRPTAGRVELLGQDLGQLDEDGLARLRNEQVGFVFQTFQLLPTLTALENVMVPLELRGEPDAARRAEELLGRVGLSGRTGHYPAQLSGGEQQRVALARAFIHQPRILFADEPTGNLDEETSAGVVELLFQLNQESGTTLVLVTHDLELGQRTDRIVRLRAGQVVEDTAVAGVDPHGSGSGSAATEPPGGKIAGPPDDSARDASRNDSNHGATGPGQSDAEPDAPAARDVSDEVSS